MRLDQEGEGKIVIGKAKITISNLNHIKKPISAVADNLEFRNAKTINIKIDNKLNLYL